MAKLVFIKTWEIELLDSKDEMMQMTLRQAMMTICHPTNNKFALFHSINKSHFKNCHLLMVLKLAKSFAHAMILAVLPYLQWNL